jgi:hypothetical protein
VGGCVTNALNREVGVAVYSGVGDGKISDTNTLAGVGVSMSANGVAGVREGGLPPGGVGV